MVSTVTLYRSPVRLVKHAAEEAEPYSSQSIARARKKMMAEIALGGEEITIEDVSYSRNDASGLLDLVTEESWKAHCIIYANKGLLRFLEQEEFNNEELKQADAYLYNERFVQSVSPYFAHAFNSVSGKLIRQNNFEELLLLLNYQGYILPEPSHEAYQKLRTYLDELNYTLRNLSWEKFIADESVLHFIFSDAWKQAINKLPSSFTSMRDELVEQLINIVLRFQHKATWYYLHQVLVQLKAVETNDFNRSEVVRIDEVIYKNTKIEGGKSKKKDGEFSTGRVIWWAIWIALVIARAATCNSNSNKNNYDFSSHRYNQPTEIKVDTYAEQKNEKLLLSLLDSLSNKKNLGITPTELTTAEWPLQEIADDPKSARNDPVIISNNTGYDAVFLYFKDIPGHYRSGLFPKLYAGFIKKGTSQKMYVLPGNGRLYFAFGERWGKLKKPITLNLTNSLSRALDRSSSEQVIINSFFSNSNRVQQYYLKNPVYLESRQDYVEDNNYYYLNKPGQTSGKAETNLILTQKKGKVAIAAHGRLLVKEDALANQLNKMEEEMEKVKTIQSQR